MKQKTGELGNRETSIEMEELRTKQGTTRQLKYQQQSELTRTLGRKDRGRVCTGQGLGHQAEAGSRAGLSCERHGVAEEKERLPDLLSKAEEKARSTLASPAHSHFPPELHMVKPSRKSAHSEALDTQSVEGKPSHDTVQGKGPAVFEGKQAKAWHKQRLEERGLV